MVNEMKKLVWYSKSVLLLVMNFIGIVMSLIASERSNAFVAGISLTLCSIGLIGALIHLAARIDVRIKCKKSIESHQQFEKRSEELYNAGEFARNISLWNAYSNYWIARVEWLNTVKLHVKKFKAQSPYYGLGVEKLKVPKYFIPTRDQLVFPELGA